MKISDISIAIVGGGPAGLALARLLCLRGARPVVLERDAFLGARAEGGSLDVHEGKGLAAIDAAGLRSGFDALARADDQCDRICDPAGNLHYDHAGGHGRPEIDRAQLRALLAGSLAPGVVRFGSDVRAVVPAPAGRHEVFGGGGSLGTFDLVVGADGAWSKVRPVVSSARPEYTGVLFVELAVDDVDARHPEVARIVPRGKLTVLGRSKGIIAQRSSGSHVRAYLMFRVAEGWLADRGIDLADPPSARAGLLRELEGFAPELLSLVHASESFVARPIVSLAPDHAWESRAGITLLGDAAHVMPPFAGEGVNMALFDALELSRALERHDDLASAIGAFEASMFARASRAARESIAGLAHVSDEGLAHTVALFRSFDDLARGESANGFAGLGEEGPRADEAEGEARPLD